MLQNQNGSCDISAPFCEPGHPHLWGPCCCNYISTWLSVTGITSACCGGSRSVQRRRRHLQLPNSWSSTPDASLLQW